MGTRRSICAENVSKYGFPIHRQERDMSCGPACLRMLAEGATGQPQSEYRWRQLSGWSDGLKIKVSVHGSISHDTVLS